MEKNNKTPYQEKFGDFKGPFLVVSNSNLTVEGIVYLFQDDGTECPSFVRGEYKDFPVGNIPWYGLNFIHLSSIEPLVISNLDELEMLCMLNPHIEKQLRDSHKDIQNAK